MPKFLVDSFELYEKLHFHELETREHVSSRLQISLGLVAALAGALSFLVGAFDRNASGIAFVLFVTLLSISALGFLYAAYQLKLAFWGNTYKEVPSGKDVKEHEAKLHNHYFEEPRPPEVLSASDKENTAKELFAADFKDFMIEKYVNCATHNAQLNMDRADRLHEANRGVLICASFAFLAFIVFTFGDLQSHDPAKVQLSTPAEVNVLSIPGDCLTCNQAQAETRQNDEGGPSSERKESTPAPTGTTQGPASSAPGTADQRGSGPPTPTAPIKEAVK